MAPLSCGTLKQRVAAIQGILGLVNGSVIELVAAANKALELPSVGTLPTQVSTLERVLGLDSAGMPGETETLPSESGDSAVDEVTALSNEPRTDGFVGRLYKALFRHTPEADGQLAVEVGDEVRLLEAAGPHWWSVERPDSSAAGFVPNRVFGRVLARPVGPKAPRCPEAGEHFQAVGGFVAEADGQISVRNGDVVRFESKLGPLWWTVTLNGQTGAAPCRLFYELVESEM